MKFNSTEVFMDVRVDRNNIGGTFMYRWDISFDFSSTFSLVLHVNKRKYIVLN
jgi:hypothetical protein